MVSLEEEQREFLRVDYENKLNFRELKSQKLMNSHDMQTRNISACGLLFRTENLPPALSSVLWIEMDDKLLNICAEIEEDLVVSKKGLLGRVVRISEGEPEKSYDVGVCFLRKNGMSEDEIESLTSVA
jgi:hypothetical protein